MEYGKVLSRAWQITWRWKVLWILGFLAALGSGGGGGGNPSYTTDSSDWGPGGPQIAPEVIALIVAFACVAVLVAIALWVISVIARGGLIAGVQQVEEEGSTAFGQAWRVGASRFWTLFGIAILTTLPSLVLALVGIATLALLIIGSVGAFDTSEAAGGLGIAATVLCGGTLCCGVFLLSIVLGQIRIYGERAAVLEGLGWIDAFKRGWQVLKENLGPTIVLWLIFFAISMVIGVLVAGGVAVLVLPVVAAFSNTDPGAWVVAPICCGGLLGMLAFALIGSVVETFTSTTWTLAYRELTGLAVPPATAMEIGPIAA